MEKNNEHRWVLLKEILSTLCNILVFAIFVYLLVFGCRFWLEHAEEVKRMQEHVKTCPVWKEEVEVEDRN